MKTAGSVVSADYRRVGPEIVAQRRLAALRVGLDPDEISFLDRNWTAVAEPERFPEPRHAEKDSDGAYLPQSTRSLTDAEYALLAPVLIDAPQARITKRRLIDLLLTYVVEGKSWQQLGNGERFTALREAVRRGRGKPCWQAVGRIADESFESPMREHVQRIAAYIFSGDLTVLAKTGMRRIPVPDRLASARVRRL